MSASQTCENCHSVFSPDAAEGLCSKCLWASLLDPLSLTNETEASQLFQNYEILGEVARGGMGVVYRARQINLQRVVALKMLLSARLPGEAELERFRAEAEAVASLEHPNIISIYDIGEEDGYPFFTMKYLPGGSLAQRLKEVRHWGQNATALLMVKIARAVHHAHLRGILHRDLKPSNILLDANDEPVVSDFGLSKQLGSERDLTISGAVLGTPAYIAPEQATGDRSLTLAADVYSLGAIFFQLLTGKPPFEEATPLQTLRSVVDNEPPRPSSINKLVDPNLEAICLTCLNKNPQQRYPTADALADDIERWLRHEPVVARRTSPRERAAKWLHRHPVAAVFSTLLLVGVIAVGGVLFFSNARIRTEKNYAVQQREIAIAAANEANQTRTQTRQSLYAADMLLASSALREGNLNLARSLVERYLPANLEQRDEDLRTFEWQYLWEKTQGDSRITLREHAAGVVSVGFSPDNKLVASADELGHVVIWDLQFRQPSMKWHASHESVIRLAFNPDGRHLVTATASGLAGIWDLATTNMVWSHKGRNSEGVHFHPDADLIGVTAAENGEASRSYAIVYNWKIGKEVLRIGPVADFESFAGSGAFAVVTRSREIGTEVWDIKEKKIVNSIPGFNGILTVSPDNKLIAGPYLDQGLFISSLLGPPEHNLNLPKIELGRKTAFSPESDFMAGVGNDQVVRIWNLRTQRPARKLVGHTSAIRDVAISSDGKWMATASMDHTVNLWPLGPGPQSFEITNCTPPYAFNADLQWLVGTEPMGDRKGFNLVAWNLTNSESETVHLHFSTNRFLAESITSNYSVLAREEGYDLQFLPLWQWDLPTKSATRNQMILAEPGRVIRSVVSPDGKLFAASQAKGNCITLWSLPNTNFATAIRNAKTPLGFPFCFSPDNKFLLAYHLPHILQLINLQKPQDIKTLSIPEGTLGDSAFSPDGKSVAVLCSDLTIRVIDTDTFQQRGRLRGHQQRPIAIAFSPDGRTLASSSYGGIIKLWSWPAQRETATISEGGPDFAFLKFQADGNGLVAGGWGKSKLFKVLSLSEIDRLAKK